MKREIEKLTQGVEAATDRLFNHRLRRAQQEFTEISDQLTDLDITNLPERLNLNLAGVHLDSIRRVPGPEIFMFMKTETHQIICYRPKDLFPDQSYYVLLLPELDEDGKIEGLSLGLAKHDGNQFFTGWADSRMSLATRRQREKSNHLWMVQYCYAPDLYSQLMANKQLGLAYLFSFAQPVEVPVINLMPGLNPT